MAVNGKTIGRVRPAPDRSRIDDVVRAEAELSAGMKPELNEYGRALNMENTTLKRRLAQAEARLAVINMGGGNSGAPIGNIWERFKSFEEEMLSTEAMTDEYKLKKLAQLVDEMKAFNAAKAKYETWVDGEVAKVLKDDKP